MNARFTTRFDTVINRWISDVLRQDPDVWRQAKRIAILNVAFAVWVLFYAAVCWGLGGPRLGLLILWTLLPIAASMMALRRGNSPALCGNISCLGGWTMMTAVAGLTGGGASTPVVWYSVLPVVATLTSGISWGLVWTAVSALSLGAFAVVSPLGFSFPLQYDPRAIQLFGFSLILGLILCQFVMASVRVGIEQRALAALGEAKRRLKETRRLMKTLQACYDFSIEDWEQLKREKAALEQAVTLRYQQFDRLDGEDDPESGDFSETPFDDDLDAEAKRTAQKHRGDS